VEKSTGGRGLEYDVDVEFTDYMLWKAIVIVVAAFVAGFMGWLR
jgi:hypothetical protein